MKQIVTYIYEYQNNQKIRNVGFLKVQFPYQAYQIQMNIKNLPLSNKAELKLYAFYKDGSYCITQHLLDLPVKNQGINVQLTIPHDHLKLKNLLHECDGFLLLGSEHAFYAGTWVNVTVDPSLLKDYSSIFQKPDAAETPETPGSPEMPETPKIPETPGTPEIPETSQIPETPETTGNPGKLPDLPDASDSLDIQNISPDQTDRQNFSPQKIQRSDLSVLPRCHWNLANNSFLLHGLYNYHHLLLVPQETSYILGIPGVYDKREARAAGLFGFPVFEKKYLNDLDLSSEERSDNDNFGYWCRNVPIP